MAEFPKSLRRTYARNLRRCPPLLARLKKHDARASLTSRLSLAMFMAFAVFDRSSILKNGAQRKSPELRVRRSSSARSHRSLRGAPPQCSLSDHVRPESNPRHSHPSERSLRPKPVAGSGAASSRRLASSCTGKAWPPRRFRWLLSRRELPAHVSNGGPDWQPFPPGERTFRPPLPIAPRFHTRDHIG